MTMRSKRSRFSASRPLRPAAFSCSSWLTRSTRLKKRPLARARMTAEATPMQRWVTADEDRVAFGVEESAGGEFANLAFIDRRIREDKLVDVLEDRKLRADDPIADRASLSVGALGADQAGDERIEFVAPGKTLAGDLVEAGAHAIQFEFAHGL